MNNRRLDVLDGLRGFAIILVFLNHIDSFYIAQATPLFFRPFIQFLFKSGNLGVTFFFILSGFLMGYLYTTPNPREFIERRYARIFPPFLTMVLCMWIFRIYPATPLLARIALILGIASLARIIWIYLVEKYHRGSILIKLFILFQCIIAFWYGFVIMRHPAIWFDSLPFFLKEGTILAANATLTLPFGNYIPLLDGVYWSLAPEMIFYLFYPYLFSPTVQSLQKKTKIFIGMFIASLFPLFFGLSLIFKHTSGFTMLFIEYFIYFCGGIGIAHIVRIQSKKQNIKLLIRSISPIAFIFVLFTTFLLLEKISGYATIIIRLLVVFPFGYIVYLLLQEETILSRIFRHKIFLFLGTVSYSMYIGQTALVDGMHLIFKPFNLVSSILFLGVTSLLLLLVSYALHFIIEEPYFQFKPEKKLGDVSRKINKIPNLIFFGIVLILFFTSYTSQFNFFSQQKKYSNLIPSPISVTDTPYSFFFTAQENNMGVVLVHLTNSVENNMMQRKYVDPLKSQRFQIRMKEKGVKDWYASQDTAPAEIGNSTSYPFGFPIILNSKNKMYEIEMSMKDIDYRSTIIFNKDVPELITIHQIPKRELITNPLRLSTHIIEKLKTAMVNPEAQLVAACISPFFLFLFLL